MSKLSEEEYKITVTLSRKGLTTLDKLKDTSGFGSRGRTIEEAIITVWELADISEGFIAKYIEMTKSGALLDFNTLFPYMVFVQTKLSRFGSPSSLKKKT